MSRCCGRLQAGLQAFGRQVLAETSVTIQLRDRTLTICPWSGGGATIGAILVSPQVVHPYGPQF